MKTKTPTQKRKAEIEAYKAFSNYLATRRAYQRGQATMDELAHALALFDLALALANIKPLG
jgi:hypothetical protein